MATKQGRGGGKKWLAIGVIVVLILGGGIWYFKHDRADEPRYQTAAIKRGDLMQTVTATGTLNPVVNVTVGSQVSGRISALNVDFNSRVTNGEVIAEIDPSTYEAQVQQAGADLSSAKASLELQQAEAQRSAELFSNNLVSRSDYETAIANLHEAQASVLQREASLNSAKANLGYCKILSPVDGVVISRAVDLGQTVASSFTTPTLFQIANDLTRMQIDANVDEADVGGVVEGQPVDFTVDAYPNRTFHGIVTQVRNAPTTVNNVVTYDCVIGVTNADYKLKPGMTANVSIITAQLTDVLEIPNSALRFHPADAAMTESNAPAASGNFGKNGNGHKETESAVVHTVYVLKNAADSSAKKLAPIQIKTGITDNIYTQVISGLKEGDRIVTGLEIPGLAADSRTRNPFSGRHRF